MSALARFLGIVPAGGLGSRLGSFRYPKELLPVAYRLANHGKEVVPMLVIEHSLSALARASVDLCIVVVSDTKHEILRYLGDGSDFGVRILYVVQTQPLGLAHAVDQACQCSSWLGCNCCMVLPDTVFEPLDALRSVKEELVARKADLVLGVFPTSCPEELGPVRIAQDGTVAAVFEKPVKTKLNNTWGVAAWSPRFSQLLHMQLATSGTQQVILGDVFDFACKNGLDVRALEFPEGVFHDLGTRAGLKGMIGFEPGRNACI